MGNKPNVADQAFKMCWDNLVAAPAFIDKSHSELHEGGVFAVAQHATLGNAGTRDVLLVPPAGVYPHITFAVRGSKETNIKLYEGVTEDGDGTDITAYNRNRNSSATASTALAHTPTVTDTGTLLQEQHVGGGIGNQRFGGEAREESEWILKPATKYLLRVTSEEADNDVSILINWYEGSEG